jgi:hypothetical protein
VNRERWIALGVLVLLLILFFVSIGVGVGKDRGGPQSIQNQAPVKFFGDLLVRPAELKDLSSTNPACLANDRLTVPPTGTCVYNLKSGFLAKRLALTPLSGSGTAKVKQQQEGQPQVVDTKNLALNQTIKFTYREDGTTLTVTCAFPTICRIGVNA